MAREVRSRSASASSPRAGPSQRETEAPRRVFRFPTWRRRRERSVSADASPTPSIYASRLSRGSCVSLAPTTVSENELLQMYPRRRAPTPMPPRLEHRASFSARLGRSVSSRLPFRSRSFNYWTRRQRENSAPSTNPESNAKEPGERSLANHVGSTRGSGTNGNGDPRPEDNPYHPYRVVGRYPDGRSFLAPMRQQERIGEPSSRAGLKSPFPTGQNLGSTARAMIQDRVRGL